MNLPNVFFDSFVKISYKIWTKNIETVHNSRKTVENQSKMLKGLKFCTTQLKYIEIIEINPKHSREKHWRFSLLYPPRPDIIIVWKKQQKCLNESKMYKTIENKLKKERESLNSRNNEWNSLNNERNSRNLVKNVQKSEEKYLKRSKVLKQSKCYRKSIENVRNSTKQFQIPPPHPKKVWFLQKKTSISQKITKYQILEKSRINFV